MRRCLALISGCVLGVLSLSPTRAVADARAGQLSGVPSLILWAWERPEDFRGLDDSIGVAFLAQTIGIGNRNIEVTPRRQPLRVSPATRLVAVTRIESVSPAASSADAASIESTANVIARTAALPQVVAVQIDFDAVRSERSLYHRVLRRVRDKLDRKVPLTITALASWCVGDRWLAQLPIDEAVAMLFRLGPLNEPYLKIAESRAMAAAPCTAVGVSLDEPVRLRREGRRVYVFNPKAWTQPAVALAESVGR